MIISDSPSEPTNVKRFSEAAYEVSVKIFVELVFILSIFYLCKTMAT